MTDLKKLEEYLLGNTKEDSTDDEPEDYNDEYQEETVFRGMMTREERDELDEEDEGEKEYVDL